MKKFSDYVQEDVLKNKNVVELFGKSAKMYVQNIVDMYIAIIDAKNNNNTQAVKDGNEQLEELKDKLIKMITKL